MTKAHITARMRLNAPECANVRIAAQMRYGSSMKSLQRLIGIATTALVAVTLALAPATALAATSPTITNPGTRNLPNLSTPVKVWLHDTTPLAGLTGTIKIVASCGAGDPDCTLTISTTTDLSAAVGYNSSDWLTGAPELGFVGTRAAVNAALATMTVALSAAKTTTVTVNATASNVAALELDDGTHYYEFVTADGNVTWEAARTLATARTLNGLSGYLVSVTSQAENDFVASKVGSAPAWLGGNDTAIDGTWVWADAPETDPFWIAGTCATGLKGMCSLSGIDHFNYWNDTEPNNYFGYENALQIMSGGTGWWNDLLSSAQYLPYVVEYSGAPTGAGTDSASRTFTVSADLPGTSRDGSGVPPIALVILALATLVAGVQIQRPTAR